MITALALKWKPLGDISMSNQFYNGLEWHRYTKLLISNIYVLYTNCFVKIGEYHHVSMG